MALAIVYSRASHGVSAPLVTVESHLSRGTVGFNIVGLAKTAVKESIHRVRSAIMNTHFEFPISRITINLAPADLPKEGGRFDLPIAIGILAASGQIPANLLNDFEFVGELALSGELRPVKGVLPIVLRAQEVNRQIFIPYQNGNEAQVLQKENVLPAKHILAVCAHLIGKEKITPFLGNVSPKTEEKIPDLAEVKGQPQAKRALEIAAAGRHSLLLIGPPGTGKSMLANRLPGILPEMTEEQALEVAAIASVSDSGFDSSHWKRIPFRAPHHTSSGIALVGGGRPPRPGEISLAHRGVLFLDELPEFSRHTLECLREPFESGRISISRASFQISFPAQFQFIAAMNPCPCGQAGSTTEYCQCNSEQIRRYLGKISGPLLDRIDMHVEVSRPSLECLARVEKKDESSLMRERVLNAYQIQVKRQGKENAFLTVSELEAFSQLQTPAEKLINQIMVKFNFSARSYHRIIKVARTIADLEKAEEISEQHVSEALQYRCLNRLKLTA